MRGGRAFTLVEILIVVVILGILSAVVVPQFTSATRDTSSMATLDQLVKLREALGVYYVRNNSKFPSQIAEGAGSWGELLGGDGAYLHDPPKNFWVDPSNRTTIIFRDTPDSGYQADYAWIFNPATGDLWAGGFDSEDKPFQHP